MPPKAAETNLVLEDAPPSVEPSPPQRNLAFAYNYQVSLVDEFVAPPPRRKNHRLDGVPTPAPKQKPTTKRDINNVETNNNHHAATTPLSPFPRLGSSGRRRSNRGKREVPLARTRVRYDMELVPPVERNPEFLPSFQPPWWKQAPPRRSLRLKEEEQFCSKCEAGSPFLYERSSVVWVPRKRSEWEDCISEMTAVCNSAALRRRKASAAVVVEDPKNPPPVPLSRDYIKDRVDIDDPLNGYQIRHGLGGWLQGFLLWTNFTTWTFEFRWDSLHPQSGIPEMQRVDHVDWDGSLAQSLEQLPRTGDPLESGIIFENVAEIGLVGGLRCGEHLLRMALDDIRSRKQYQFVVLQATETSRTFYEKFGFVRVGAICRYQSPQQQHKTNDHSDAPIVGYRHWTHSNESNASLEMHGGPSYMMCLALPSAAATPSQGEELCEACALPLDPEPASIFLSSMLDYAVENKPTVEPLASSSNLLPRLMHQQRRGPPLLSPAAMKRKALRNATNVATPLVSSKLSDDEDAHRKAATKASAKKRKREGSRDLQENSGAANAERDESPVKREVVTRGVSISNDASSRQAGDEETSEEPTAKRQKNTKVESEQVASDTPPQPDKAREEATPALDDSVAESVDAKAAEVAEVHGSIPEERGDSPDEQNAGTSQHAGNQPANPVAGGVATEDNVSSADVSDPSVRVKAGDNEDVTPKRKRKKSFDKKEGDGPGRRLTRLKCGETQSTVDEKATTTPTPRVVRKSPRVEEARLRVQPKRTESGRAAEKPTKAVRKAPPRKSKQGAPKPINRAELRKQKVKAYPRSRPHFYNRVVKPAKAAESTPQQYYFVLNYDEDTEAVQLVPMEARGRMMGKRHGRPRFQCCLGSTDENFITGSSADYQVVSATMVMKTPVVAQEAWDIEDDDVNDSDDEE